MLLADQDRARWVRPLIDEGHALVRACLRRGAPGPFQIQAAINAVHTDAADPAATDWSQIVQLYDQLLACAPTPVVALNRAVALAETKGPGVALDAIDDLELDRYVPFHVARAELLARLGRVDEAADAYDRARSLSANSAQRAFLANRRARLLA